MDDKRMREPEYYFGKDYFEEQLERIRVFAPASAVSIRKSQTFTLSVVLIMM